jgi:Glycosyl transferase family 2
MSRLGRWIGMGWEAFRAAGNRMVIRLRSGREGLRELQMRRQGLRKVREMNQRVQRYGKSVESLIQETDASIFSVLIPAYHAQAFIEETLGTIVNQQMPPGVELDVVVAVDGCPETRDAILAAMERMEPKQRKTVRMLMHARNYGTYMMQNTLLHASRGDLVHIIGADDGLAPGALQKLWDFSQGCRQCCSGFILRPMSAVCDAQLEPKPGRELHQHKGALVFTKSVLEKLGGFAPWMCAADSDFLQRAEKKGIPMFSLPEVTYWYRQHGEQLTHGAGTGMRSGVREAYWRETQARVMNGRICEAPVIAPDGICTEGAILAGAESI